MEVLQHFDVDYSGFLTLADVLYDNAAVEPDGERKTTRSIARAPQRLTFDEILEMVVRMKGDKSPTVQHIVHLRQYTKQRFEKIETGVLSRLEENVIEMRKCLDVPQNS